MVLSGQPHIQRPPAATTRTVGILLFDQVEELDALVTGHRLPQEASATKY